MKIRTLVWGINGKMGRWVYELVSSADDFLYVGGVDKEKKDLPNTYIDASEIREPVDVIIDFSRTDSLDNILSLAKRLGSAVVLATTGYSESELQKIEVFSAERPIFMSGNMSIGVNLACLLSRLAAERLGKRFDVEIIEKHHNAKVDSPSGTALMLESSIRKAEGADYGDTVFGRSGAGLRKQGEIGIHAIRGGTIVGEHTVIFAGADEILEIRHTALSRRVFAEGALTAARFIITKKAGLYNSESL